MNIYMMDVQSKLSQRLPWNRWSPQWRKIRATSLSITSIMSCEKGQWVFKLFAMFIFQGDTLCATTERGWFVFISVGNHVSSTHFSKQIEDWKLKAVMKLINEFQGSVNIFEWIKLIWSHLWKRFNWLIFWPCFLITGCFSIQRCWNFSTRE